MLDVWSGRGRRAGSERRRPRRADRLCVRHVADPGVLVIAFRVPGASNSELLSARIASFRQGEPPFGREKRAIGGKSVTWVAYSPFPDSVFEREYLYAKDHVLVLDPARGRRRSALGIGRGSDRGPPLTHRPAARSRVSPPG